MRSLAKGGGAREDETQEAEAEVLTATGAGPLSPAPRCPTKNCTSREFWRLVGETGKLLYPEAGWVCDLCHPGPHGSGSTFSIERITKEGA